MNLGINTRRLTFALLLPLLVCCSSRPSAPSDAEPETSPEVPSVSVAPVKQRAIERRAQIVGQLIADEEVTLRNEVDGTIEQVMVEFGSTVTAGQLLLTLDAQDYRLTVARARAALTQSLAVLGLPAEGDEDSIEVGQVATVAMASAALKDARTKLKSAARLVKNRDIPEQRYLEAVQLEEERQAAVQEARDRVRAQVATVKINRAQLAIELQRLGKTRIVAPFAGSIVSKMVSRGQYVRADSDLLLLVRDDPLRLRGRIPETGAALVRKGIQVKFQTDAFPDRWFEAVVSDVSPVLDPATRTLSAEAKVANPGRLLKPGMFAVIDVLVDPSAPVLVVPQEAIFSLAGLQKILLVTSDGRLSERTVETGVKVEGATEVIASDIKEGDLVVVSDQSSLQDGMVVQISENRG